MPEFLFGLAIGSIIASGCWWIHVRTLNGVISDLKDVGSDAKKLVGK